MSSHIVSSSINKIRIYNSLMHSSSLQLSNSKDYQKSKDHHPRTLVEGWTCINLMEAHRCSISTSHQESHIPSHRGQFNLITHQQTIWLTIKDHRAHRWDKRTCLKAEGSATTQRDQLMLRWQWTHHMQVPWQLRYGPSQECSSLSFPKWVKKVH